MIRISRFLKDLFTTGFSQVAVVIFSIILLKLLAAGFIKAHFGLFNLVRRWDMVLIPLLTLNMSIGVTRYVSYEEENGPFFLHFSLLVTIALCTLTFPLLILFPAHFSRLLFESPDYGLLVIIMALFLTANILHLIVYSYFRGKMNMNTANLLRTLFFGFPLLPAAYALWIKHKTGGFAPLEHLYYFFLIYSLWGIVLSLAFLRREISPKIIKQLFAQGWTSIKESFQMGRAILAFSLSRIPAVFFSAMVLSFPVLYTGHKFSLEAAGYMGIVVAVVRLFESFSMPFNMILLPKFSHLQREHDTQHIADYSRVMLDFIFTFLPFCGVLTYGLMPLLVSVWFGPQYMVTADSVALSILFSVFYLAFALIRGVLDGLYEFPYNNFVSFLGFLTIAIMSVLMGKDIYTLSIAFSMGMVTLGLVSIYLLAKKLNLKVNLFLPLKVLITAALVFVLLYGVDLKLADQKLSGLYHFFLSISFRILAVIVLWLVFWRKTLWYKEVLKRIGRGPKISNEIKKEVSNS